MITNDVDEGILLADRIIPLSMGPAATLGPQVAVNIPRPRDRKALNHDPVFKQTRKAVFDYLLGPGRKQPAAAPGTPIEGVPVAADLTPKNMNANRKRFQKQLIEAA